MTIREGLQIGIKRIRGDVIQIPKPPLGERAMGQITFWWRRAKRDRSQDDQKDNPSL